MKKSILFIALSLLSVQISAQKSDVKTNEITANFTKSTDYNNSLNYVLQLPKTAKKNFPLIVFLHGSGERGTEIQKVKAHSPFTYQNLFPEEAAILAPQCPENIWWNTESVYQLILEISKNYKVDKSRIYLTGLSMGGWGTWKLANEHPEMFAAVVPVCAPSDRWMKATAERYKNLPIKIFHGGNDDIVSPQNSIEIYQEIKKVNPSVSLTIFPDDNHNSWDSTYSDPKLYQWMFQQKK